MIGFNRFRSGLLISAISIALIAFAHRVVEVFRDLACKVAAAVMEPVSMARAEAELAQNAASNIPTNNGKPSAGSVSGDSALSFASLMKDLNSRAFAAAC